MLKKKISEELEKEIELFLSNYNSEETLNKLGKLFLEKIMLKERDIFLEKAKEEGNKANGYYGRDYVFGIDKLRLNIPRVRKGKFRSSILPSPYNKFGDRFEEFVINLIMHSYSPNKIKDLLNSLNLAYSAEQIEEIKESVYEEAQQINQKELSENAFAIMIDAKHTKIRNENTKQVQKAVIYSVIGIDMEGYKDLYGYYIMEGNENREDWLVIFNQLISRGLKRVMLIISDDFPGLSSAIETLFPKSDHQLCHNHLKKNIRKNLSKKDAAEVNNFLSKLKLYNNFDEATVEFENFVKKFQSKYSTYIPTLLANKERYFNFIKYPKEVRQHIYTTNQVESINNIIENIERSYSGYFQSKKTACVGVYIAYKNLIDKKWKRPLFSIVNNIYEINQLFASKFFVQTHNFI